MEGCVRVMHLKGRGVGWDRAGRGEWNDGEGGCIYLCCTYNLWGYGIVGVEDVFSERVYECVGNSSMIWYSVKIRNLWTCLCGSMIFEVAAFYFLNLVFYLQ